MRSSSAFLKALTVLALWLSASGCVSNRYAEFYVPDQKVRSTETRPTRGEIELRHGAYDSMQAEIEAMLRDGYELLGTSHFWWEGGRRPGDPEAVRHARDVGAEIVVVSNQHAGSRQTTVATPVYVPGNSSTTTHRGSVYGYGGSASVRGTSTTTTPGKTVIVPTTKTVQKYNYAAAFFRRRTSTPIFGAYFDDLSEDLRRRLQTNQGVFIRLVIKGSPAYRADILRGDVITHIDGHRILDSSDFTSRLEANKGKAVDLLFYRNDRLRRLRVTLGD